jgi:hypothetical protein
MGTKKANLSGLSVAYLSWWTYKRLASDHLPHLSVLHISIETSKASIICNLLKINFILFPAEISFDDESTV